MLGYTIGLSPQLRFLTVQEELSGDKIHNLENLLTTDHTVHHHFDLLNLWLEATVSLGAHVFRLANFYFTQNTPNYYKVCMASGRGSPKGYGLPEYVTMRSMIPGELPLPNPSYLALHAACCRVAHMSGAARSLDG